MAFRIFSKSQAKRGDVVKVLIKFQKLLEKFVSFDIQPKVPNVPWVLVSVVKQIIMVIVYLQSFHTQTLFMCLHVHSEIVPKSFHFTSDCGLVNDRDGYTEQCKHSLNLSSRTAAVKSDFDMRKRNVRFIFLFCFAMQMLHFRNNISIISYQLHS